MTIIFPQKKKSGASKALVVPPCIYDTFLRSLFILPRVGKGWNRMDNFTIQDT